MTAPLSEQQLAEIEALLGVPSDPASPSLVRPIVEASERLRLGKVVGRNARAEALDELLWSLPAAFRRLLATETEATRLRSALAEITTVLDSRGGEGPTNGALLGRIAGIVRRVEAGGGDRG